MLLPFAKDYKVSQKQGQGKWVNSENKKSILSIISTTLKDTSVGIWNRERLQTVLYKAVKHEDVEIAAKCLKLGVVDVNTRYEPVSKMFNLQSDRLVQFLSQKFKNHS